MRMRSCALRIFEAATISIALVILRVFCTLLILMRISLVPGMSCTFGRVQFQDDPFFFQSLIASFSAFSSSADEVLLVLDALDQIARTCLDVVAHRALGGQRLLHVDVVEVAVVHREQRQRHFPDLQRLVLRLLHQLGHHAAALELLAGGFVEVGGELREGRELAVLGEREAHAAAGVAGAS